MVISTRRGGGRNSWEAERLMGEGGGVGGWKEIKYKIEKIYMENFRAMLRWRAREYVSTSHNLYLLFAIRFT